MKQSIKGKIRNFNLSNSKIYLFSIYEAISNSIHSIYINNIKDSKIDIIIDAESQEVKSIEIIDYAEGFTKRNFETFLESEMTFKEEYGCKGVGRFIWLAGFKDVKVSSKFFENNKNYIRNFQFNESWDDDTPNETDTKKEVNNANTDNRTSVKLLNPRIKIGFRKVKNDIIKHFLPQFFLLGEKKYNIEINIKYYIKDKKDKAKEEYDSINTKDFKYEKKDTFALFNYKNEEKFNLYHVFTKDITNNKHEILLCAGFRVVQNSSFSNFPNDYIYDENKQKKFSSYHAVVCSNFLDKSVSLDRGNLSFPTIEYTEENEDYIKDFNPITNSMIIEKVKELSLEYLKENKYTKKWDEDKESKIEKFKKEHAYLNPLLSLVNIDWSDSYEDIYKKVNQKKVEKESDIKSRIDKLVKTMESNDTDNFTTSKEFSKIIKDSSDINFLELSAYVYYRKYMLELFSKILKYKNKDTKEYNREDKVHNFLYPMKETSDSIQYEDHNLWIIDDRWSFYRYIFSDKKMNSVIDGSESKERPDILLFSEDKENSLIDSILVVEIKRPGKPGKHDDPHLQVYRYIEEIIKRKSIKTSEGNIISISESPRFYSYILCDNANNFINDMCLKYGYEKTADGSYYFLKAKNNTIDFPTIDQYIIPFDVLLNTAKMRNKAFIDRLLK